MSEFGSMLGDDQVAQASPPAGRRRARRQRRKGPGCLIALVVLALLAGGGYLAVTKGVSAIKDQFESAPDYPGPGTGSVTFQVTSGDTASDIGRNLKKDGVVKSVDAFISAAEADPDSTRIQAGYYQLKQQMKASDVVKVLVDPANLVKAGLTIPEGYRIGQVVSAIVAKTDFTKQEVTALLDDPSQIGLPAEADGNPEGYLFPATYDVTPGETAQQLLSQMVAKTEEVEKSLDIEAGAKALGLTPHEVITVASILEYEASNATDYAKVARVIYNRLDQGMALQLDSTVSYVSKSKGDVWTTPEERNNDSLYNTYQHTGLPPGPIGSVGEAALKAALNPPKGDWLYFVPDFATGKTLFTASYAQHLRNVAKAQAYCRTHPEC